MPGLTSTVLSELESTRIVTSPAPVFFFLRNELIRFSRYVPSFVWGRPAQSQTSIYSLCNIAIHN